MAEGGVHGGEPTQGVLTCDDCVKNALGPENWSVYEFNLRGDGPAHCVARGCHRSNLRFARGPARRSPSANFWRFAPFPVAQCPSSLWGRNFAPVNAPRVLAKDIQNCPKLDSVGGAASLVLIFEEEDERANLGIPRQGRDDETSTRFARGAQWPAVAPRLPSAARKKGILAQGFLGDSSTIVAATLLRSKLLAGFSGQRFTNELPRQPLTLQF